MAVQVPSQYQQYVTDAANKTGLPVAVVAAQANVESGFNPNAVSPAGAKGFWQFMPGTYNAVAKQAGVPQNTEFNVADETKAYEVYMNQLLAQEGGNVYKALEAYNAGPGNLPAGSAYAASILNAAGQPKSLQATQNATLTGIHIPGTPWTIPTSPGDVTSGIANQFKDLFNAMLSGLGVPSLKDALQRLGLILLGVALIIVGLIMISKETGVAVNSSGGGKSANVEQKAAETAVEV